MAFSFPGILGSLSNTIANAGRDLRLPEFGISEAVASAARNVSQAGTNSSAKASPTTQGTAAQPASQDQGGGYYYSGGGSARAAAPAGPSAADLAFLADQEAQLRSLLGRTDTGLAQGLARSDDQYQTQLGNAQTDKANQVTDQNKQKLSAYDTINKNAGQGYRSLAQIIGRAAGTGSSAFQEALPDAVGKDTSSKRFGATGTFDTNLSKIDASYQNTLADLLRQKKTNEEGLRTGIEQQRQQLNQQLISNAGQRAQALGGGYDQVKAAQAPFQQAIENSRNNVENFFNQFRTEYTPLAIAPEVNAYNTDRTAVNAEGQGATPENPYSQLLRKKLQEGGV